MFLQLNSKLETRVRKEKVHAFYKNVLKDVEFMNVYQYFKNKFEAEILRSI